MMLKGFLILMMVLEVGPRIEAQADNAIDSSSRACKIELMLTKSGRRRVWPGEALFLGFTALADAGLKVDLKLFRYYNPKANDALTKAFGFPMDSETFYRYLPPASSVAQLYNNVMGIKPADKGADRSVAKKSKGFAKPKDQTRRVVEVFDEQMLQEQKAWLTQILRTEVRDGHRPNFLGLASGDDTGAFISAVRIAYNGSLYDAVVDAGLEPGPVFDEKYPAPRTELIDRLRYLGKTATTPSALTDLADAICMEFQHAQIPTVRPLLLALFNGKKIVMNDDAENILDALARNNTLLSYYRIARKQGR